MVVVCAALSGCGPGGAGAYAVDGSVLNDNGEAVSDCNITVEVIRGGPVGETALRADRSGHFSWPLPPGEYELTATCNGLSGESTVEVIDEPVETEITVQ
jgi:hypothetical protein